jgi:hypothetical protein
LGNPWRLLTLAVLSALVGVSPLLLEKSEHVSRPIVLILPQVR